MRHRIRHQRFNRTSAHRVALRRNLAQSLIEHEQITTTLPKAKDTRRFIDRLITEAVKVRKLGRSGDQAGALRARRMIHRLLSDRVLIPKDHRSAYEAMSNAARRHSIQMASGRKYRTGDSHGKLEFTAESVTHKLIEKIAGRFEDRAGGYTRVVRLAKTRLGDRSPLAMIQLVGGEEAPRSLTKPARSARRRRADARYALAIKVGKTR
jgi:large subunit ribosomal protein L17